MSIWYIACILTVKRRVTIFHGMIMGDMTNRPRKTDETTEPMTQAPRFPTFFREWRESRGLTLRELAAKAVDDNGVPILSYASLGRIERGLQPYSQPIVEAIALALDVPPFVLLFAPPDSALAQSGKLYWRMDPRDREPTTRILLSIIECVIAARAGK